MKQFVIFFTICLLFFSFTYAMRPFSTDDAGVVEEGVVEYEGGVDFNNEAISSYLSIGTGISKICSFSLSVPFSINPERNAEMVEVGTKINLLSGENLPDTSVSFSLTPGESTYSTTIIMSYEIGNFGLHLNYGYSYPDETTPFGIAGEYNLFEKFQILLEGYFENLKNSAEVYILSGIRFLPAENLSIDFAVNTGIKNEKIPVYTAGFVLDM